MSHPDRADRWSLRPPCLASDPAWGATEDSFVVQTVAVPENLGFVRAIVAAFCVRLPFTLDEVEDVKLAVSEMVANAIVHAYPDEHGPVWIAGRVVDGTLEVLVADRGRGISDVDAARRPGYSSVGGEHLGIGFSVAETYVDELDVDSIAGEGTCVRLRKRPSAASGPAGR